MKFKSLLFIFRALINLNIHIFHIMWGRNLIRFLMWINSCATNVYWIAHPSPQWSVVPVLSCFKSPCMGGLSIHHIALSVSLSIPHNPVYSSCIIYLFHLKGKPPSHFLHHTLLLSVFFLEHDIFLKFLFLVMYSSLLSLL